MLKISCTQLSARMHTSDHTVGSLSVPTDENLKDSARKNAGAVPRTLFAYVC